MVKGNRTRGKTLVLLMALAGCNENENARVAQIAQEAAARQAAQNQEMASLNRQMAEAHRQQIDAEADAREKLLAMSQDVQQQRGELETERHEMVNERRELAEDQRWDSVLGPALLGTASLLASVLPLVLCWHLLHGLRHDRNDEADLSALLVMDLTADEPLLLASPKHESVPQIDHRDERGSPGPQLGFQEEPPE